MIIKKSSKINSEFSQVPVFPSGYYRSDTLRPFSVSLLDFTDIQPPSRGASLGCCTHRADGGNPCAERRLPAEESVCSTVVKAVARLREMCVGMATLGLRRAEGAGGAQSESMWRTLPSASALHF